MARNYRNGKITHGLSRKAPEYRHWINMKSRCCTKSSTGWKNYGGRGIGICKRWMNSFENFYSDMGPRPSSKHSIDRIDVDGDYSPSNCRWATPKEQLRNTTSNHMVEIDGEVLTLVEAAERAPVPYNTVLYRLRRGWDIERAITRPAMKGVKP